MTLQRRVTRLEQRRGGDELRIVVCWCAVGKPCDCGAAAAGQAGGAGARVITWPDEEPAVILRVVHDR